MKTTITSDRRYNNHKLIVESSNEERRVFELDDDDIEEVKDGLMIYDAKMAWKVYQEYCDIMIDDEIEFVDLF